MSEILVFVLYYLVVGTVTDSLISDCWVGPKLRYVYSLFIYPTFPGITELGGTLVTSVHQTISTTSS